MEKAGTMLFSIFDFFFFCVNLRPSAVIDIVSCLCVFVVHPVR
jgi:hypothetical protein